MSNFPQINVNKRSGSFSGMTLKLVVSKDQACLTRNILDIDHFHGASTHCDLSSLLSHSSLLLCFHDQACSNGVKSSGIYTKIRWVLVEPL